MIDAGTCVCWSMRDYESAALNVYAAPPSQAPDGAPRGASRGGRRSLRAGPDAGPRPCSGQACAGRGPQADDQGLGHDPGGRETDSSDASSQQIRPFGLEQRRVDERSLFYAVMLLVHSVSVQQGACSRASLPGATPPSGRPPHCYQKSSQKLTAKPADGSKEFQRVWPVRDDLSWVPSWHVIPGTCLLTASARPATPCIAPRISHAKTPYILGRPAIIRLI